MRKRNSFISFVVVMLMLRLAAATEAARYCGWLLRALERSCGGIRPGLHKWHPDGHRRNQFCGGIEMKGQRHTLRLEKMDDQANPEKAVSNARTLQKEKKAIVIFKALESTILPLMKFNMEKKNEFLIMAYASIPQISAMGNELLLTQGIPLTYYSKIMSDLAWDKGWRKCAMVVTTGAYGEIWRKSFSENWLKKGGTITADKPANYFARTDFTAPLAEALVTDPDFLLIGGPSATAAWLKSAHENWRYFPEKIASRFLYENIGRKRICRYYLTQNKVKHCRF